MFIFVHTKVALLISYLRIFKLLRIVNYVLIVELCIKFQRIKFFQSLNILLSFRGETPLKSAVITLNIL